MAYVAIAGFFILAIVGGVGFGVASADSMDDAERNDTFGFSKTPYAPLVASDSIEDSDKAAESQQGEQLTLASTTPRDINVGMRMIDDMEKAEEERTIADNAAVLHRVAAKKAQQGIDMPPEEVNGAAPAPDAVEYDLPAVDWSVGKKAFLAEWTARIDAYLEGSPLAGYGSVFAEAAWETGIDPFFFTATSTTESGRGLVCFRPCNAWGWGNTGWSDWDTAIREHVAGLASGYGYSITPGAAQSYCPPTWDSWYARTYEQMTLI